MGASGSTEKEQRATALPHQPRIDEQLAKDANAQLRSAFFGPRGAVIRLSPESREAWEKFRDDGAEWLQHASDAEKRKFEAAPDEVNPRKKNIGYLDARPVKEFLKLRISDVGTEAVPPAVSQSFAALVESCVPLMETCFRAVADAPTANGEGGLDPYMRKSFADEVWRMIHERSSITLVHYFPQGKEDADDSTNDSNAACAEDELTESGRIYPSKTHTDTGLMTFILCSPVSGLEVWDHVGTSKWLQVEELFDPNQDLFVILGRKAEIFAENQVERKFQPTTHRVSLPLDTRRFSVLFFADVPQ